MDNEAGMQELSKLLSSNDAQESDIHLFFDDIHRCGAIRDIDEAILNRYNRGIRKERRKEGTGDQDR